MDTSKIIWTQTLFCAFEKEVSNPTATFFQDYLVSPNRSTKFRKSDAEPSTEEVK